MTQYTVVAVRKEASIDGTHKHLAGVVTSGGEYYSRSHVANSIDKLGDTWTSAHGGHSARIHTVKYCPRAGCTATPYIRTNPDGSKADDLENLPAL